MFGRFKFVVFADIAELCLIPDVVIPPKFKVPDFDKYKGTTCPKNHLKMYCGEMGAYAKHEKVIDAFLLGESCYDSYYLVY